MPFELFIALRYLVARRKQAFISLISVISTIGVAVGVMALIIALALMTGLQGELRSRIVGASPHIYVLKAGDGLADTAAEMQAIRAVPRVIGASPGVMGKALASSGEQQAFISVKGVDPATEGEVTDVSERMVGGSMAALSSRDADSRWPVLSPPIICTCPTRRRGKDWSSASARPSRCCGTPCAIPGRRRRSTRNARISSRPNTPLRIRPC
jgi:ABC-type lipoprotein release transport system permease subunit